MINLDTINTKHSSALMLEYNRGLLIKLIYTRGPISRADLTKITKLSPTTVGRIIGSLIEEQLVIEVGTSDPAIGRKAKLLNINGDGRYSIGIDVDLYRISAGLVDLKGNVIAKETFPMPDSITIESISELINTAISSIFTLTNTPNKVIGVGISIPGNVQWPEGIINLSPQFGWENVDLKSYLNHYLNRNIYIDNNVKATAAAEILYGYGKSYPNFVILHVGSGIGSAVIMNNDICRGSNGLFGEIGHMTIQPTGRLCSCGRHGCLQSVACMAALEEMAEIPFPEIIENAKNGDSYCSSLLTEATNQISMLISNIVNMYDPPLILLSGEMLDQYEFIANDVISKSKSYMWKNLKNPPLIKNCSINYADSSILSAASIVFQQFFTIP